MRAVIMNAPQEMETGSWETPSPGAGEVLISVGAAGICAGDMYFYLGKNPYAVYPQICGHEVAGTVIEVGQGVTGIEVGAKVAVEPFIGCGKCYPCRVGKSNCCVNLTIIGVQIPGGYAEFLTAPARHVHVVPDGLSLFEASFAEPVAIGVQACRRGDIGEEFVLILGCGPIGLALIEVAKSRGAQVVATDILESRLEMARKLGADAIFADDNLTAKILEQTNGEGAPVVIEATGNPTAMEQAAELVAAGGRIVIVGLVKQGVGVTFPGLDFTRKEMTILGSRASVNCFPESLELLANGSIQYPKLATEFDLWDAPQIFKQLAADPGSIQKGVLIREAGK
jgi:2-desacetyl-2-hydroxyethyl bacteriochlorophyllide A dehydrogenase